MDRGQVERWLDAYRKAWASDAPSDIEAHFTEDATYSPFPFTKEVWQGRDRIVEKWIERGDAGSSWLFEDTILAVDGDTAVIEGRTLYHATEHDPEAEYSNIWVVRFDDEGRAREFREWWVERGPGDSAH
jgi:ketosteroid isomerase-like protein